MSPSTLPYVPSLRAARVTLNASSNTRASTPIFLDSVLRQTRQSLSATVS